MVNVFATIAPDAAGAAPATVVALAVAVTPDRAVTALIAVAMEMALSAVPPGVTVLVDAPT
ncbi:MAG: hypothetical protein A2496_16220 [Burkholderiales bacterium RIFOXYC12_FULL_60_6]|nr:MAG: hypothetical protein A2496_16220 [Burkholderiales bacterium RIFOXYC12_FULL_60_6]